MFQLTKEEFDSLRLQFVTLKRGQDSIENICLNVFTEQGVAMLQVFFIVKGNPG